MKKSFGACITNFMANKYRFKNGISLFMSDTTFSLMTEGEVSEMLHSKVPTLDRCQALCDFVLFDLNHTGDEIGRWLEDAVLLVANLCTLVAMLLMVLVMLASQ